MTDDDIVSFIGFMLIVYPLCREKPVHPHFFVPKLGLSLYLMTQCQVKLHHPVTSLAQTLDYIEVSRQQVDEKFTLDQLLLKLTERKILGYIFCSL